MASSGVRAVLRKDLFDCERVVKYFRQGRTPQIANCLIDVYDRWNEDLTAPGVLANWFLHQDQDAVGDSIIIRLSTIALRAKQISLKDLLDTFTKRVNEQESMTGKAYRVSLVDLEQIDNSLLMFDMQEQRRSISNLQGRNLPREDQPLQEGKRTPNVGASSHEIERVRSNGTLLDPDAVQQNPGFHSQRSQEFQNMLILGGFNDVLHKPLIPDGSGYLNASNGGVKNSLSSLWQNIEVKIDEKLEERNQTQEENMYLMNQEHLGSLKDDIVTEVTIVLEQYVKETVGEAIEEGGQKVLEQAELRETVEEIKQAVQGTVLEVIVNRVKQLELELKEALVRDLKRHIPGFAISGLNQNNISMIENTGRSMQDMNTVQLTRAITNSTDRFRRTSDSTIRQQVNGLQLYSSNKRSNSGVEPPQGSNKKAKLEEDMYLPGNVYLPPAVPRSKYLQTYAIDKFYFQDHHFSKGVRLCISDCKSPRSLHITYPTYNDQHDKIHLGTPENIHEIWCGGNWISIRLVEPTYASFWFKSAATRDIKLGFEAIGVFIREVSEDHMHRCFDGWYKGVDREEAWFS